MALLGSSLVYNNQSSEEFGVILVSFSNTANELQSLGLSREILYDETVKGRRNIYGSKYNDVLSFDFTLVKKNGLYFTNDDIREINRWLSGYQFPKKMTINNEGLNTQNTYFNCIITESHQNVAGRTTIGLSYTATCDAPYGWEDFETEYIITKPNQSILFCNTSDELGDYLYPTLTITMTKAGNFTLYNTQEPNNIISFTDLVVDEKLTLDCLNEIVTSSEEKRTNTIGGVNNFSYNWLRLLPNDNNLIASGNSIIKIFGTFPRKVGV